MAQPDTALLSRAIALVLSNKEQLIDQQLTLLVVGTGGNGNLHAQIVNTPKALVSLPTGRPIPHQLGQCCGLTVKKDWHRFGFS